MCLCDKSTHHPLDPPTHHAHQHLSHFSSCKNLPEKVELWCDGKPVTLPPQVYIYPRAVHHPSIPGDASTDLLTRHPPSPHHHHQTPDRVLHHPQHQLPRRRRRTLARAAQPPCARRALHRGTSSQVKVNMRGRNPRLMWLAPILPLLHAHNPIDQLHVNIYASNSTGVQALALRRRLSGGSGHLRRPPPRENTGGWVSLQASPQRRDVS